MRKSNATLILPFYQSFFQDLYRTLGEKFDFSEEDVSNFHESKRVFLFWAREVDHITFVSCISQLGKSFERAIISTQPLELPDGFQRFPGSDLPYLFHCFFRLVFNDSARVAYDPYQRCSQFTANAVKALRQIFLAFSKVEKLDCLAREEDEITSFVSRVTKPLPIDHRLMGHSLSYARMLLTHLFRDDAQSSAAIAQYCDEPFGLHGPGAVYEGEIGAEKWGFNFVPGQDQRIFYSQPGHLALALVPDPDHRIDRQSRLAVVPKDFRGHRLICIEPKELMFAQQGLMRLVYDIVHRSPLTRRCICFDDQTVSFFASKKRSCSTIDLKDASDRLSITLARLLLPREIFKLFTQCRSSSILLPDGRIVDNVQTLFTMGNALCFPVETLVFWAISLGTILDDLFPSQPHKVIAEMRKPDYGCIGSIDLRVFGDDIIIPETHFTSVCTALEGSGLLVNHGKSCAYSYARESCGSWWYGGFDCRITRMKTISVESPLDWLSFVDYSTDLYRNGFLQTATTLLMLADQFWPAPWHLLGYPILQVKGGLRPGYRWNSDYQILEYETLSSHCRSRVLPGSAGLYAAFTGQATRTLIDRDTPVESIWVSVN